MHFNLEQKKGFTYFQKGLFWAEGLVIKCTLMLLSLKRYEFGIQLCVLVGRE